MTDWGAVQGSLLFVLPIGHDQCLSTSQGNGMLRHLALMHMARGAMTAGVYTAAARTRVDFRYTCP